MEKTILEKRFVPRIDAFNQDCLDLFKDMSLDSLLYKTTLIATTRTNACYCFCGILDENKEIFLQYYVTGFTETEMSLLGLSGDPADSSVHFIHHPYSVNSTDPYFLFGKAVLPDKYPYIHSFLYVPIFFADEQIGAIILLNKIGAPVFSLEDREAAEALAIYDGVAINNSIAFEQAAIRENELSKRYRNLELLNELAKISADSSLKPETVIDVSMGHIMGYLDIEIGEVFLRNGEDTDEFDLDYKRGHSLPDGLLGFTRLVLGEGKIGKAMENHRSYLLRSDEMRIVNQRKPSHVNLNFIICLPLVASQGVNGMIVLASHIVDESGTMDLQFLNSITTWVAALLENRELAKKQQVIAVLEERERIGMDLHDGVIQSIFGVGLTLENARLNAIKNPPKTEETLKACIENLNDTIRDIRSYIMDLKPDHLTRENFIQSLRRLVSDFHNSNLVPTDFVSDMGEYGNLTDEQVNAFFLMCKEALSNISKHAGKPDKVTVSFYETHERFVLEVTDDGDGFDPTSQRDNTHHGVNNMQSRARGLGGDMDIESVPGEGTSVFIWLPNIKQK